jgi:phosphohistidine phosphatase SixA
MDLILWRRADVARGGRGEKRRLTAKGTKQAKRVAARLRRKLLSEVTVLTNPAAA